MNWLDDLLKVLAAMPTITKDLEGVVTDVVKLAHKSKVVPALSSSGNVTSGSSAIPGSSNIITTTQNQ